MILTPSVLVHVGDFKAAGTHLCQVFGQEPRDAVAQARLGVVEAWQQNYSSASRRLSKVLEKDSSSLDFLLALIPSNQRKCIAQVSFKRQDPKCNTEPLSALLALAETKLVSFKL